MTTPREFTEPALWISQNDHSKHLNTAWRDVPRSRQLWLRGLDPGAYVDVVDDFGNRYRTMVRGIEHPKRAHGSKEPQIWLFGHRSSYAASRIRPPKPLIPHDQLPAKEHERTISWSFCNFGRTVHVVVEGGRRSDGTAMAVCCSLNGPYLETDEMTPCPQCCSFLRVLKTMQDPSEVLGPPAT